MSTDPMSDERKRIRIAEACGWTKVEWYEDNQGPPILHGFPPPALGLGKDGEWESKGTEHSKHVPNFLFDLNAMHEAEKALEPLDLTLEYVEKLQNHTPPGKSKTRYGLVHATSRQRADAFLAVLGPAPQP